MNEHPLILAIRSTLGPDNMHVHPGACPGCTKCGLDSDDGAGIILKEQSLDSATIRGNDLPIWDDGFGPLWIYIESLGPVGIVRADSWESAYEWVLDEIMPDGDEEDALNPDYGANAETGELAEGYHYRSNGVPSNEHLGSPIAFEDLNGSILRPLTSDDIEHYEIALELSPSEQSLIESADEGEFSWRECDSCGCTSGGQRYPAHYLDSSETIHIDICGDCYLFHANGDLPEIETD